MAEDKSSFILYADLLPTVEKLSDKRAGILFKTILRYVNDKNPEVTDILVDLVFEPLKQKLKRDLKKWEAERSKKSEAGKLGGIRSGEARRSRSKRSTASKHEANEAVSVSGNESVSDNVNGSVRLPQSAECIYDAEKEILGNQIQFERIASTSKKTSVEDAKISLRKFHLFLEEKNRYPQSRKQIFSGFERWLMNETDFKNNTHHNGRNNHTKGIGKDKVNTTGRPGL